MFHDVVELFGCADSSLPAAFGVGVFAGSTYVGEGEGCFLFVIIVEAGFACFDR